MADNDSPPSAADLEELERRWREEDSPRLLLKLAEEYRHRGRLDDAVELLEEGVERHGEYLAPRVALGRYRLELGRAREAASVLEAAVERDPTQLVANKLLVRAYLELGEVARARDRLDFYTLLNEADPAIEELQQEIERRGSESQEAARSSAPERVSGDRRPAAEGPETQEPERKTPAGDLEGDDAGEAAAEAAAAEAAAEDAVEDAVEVAVDPFPEAFSGGEPDGLVPAREDGERKRPRPGGPGPAGPAAGRDRVGSSAEAGEPFPGLGAAGRRTRYLASLGAEGIFPLAWSPREEQAPASGPAAPATASAVFPPPAAATAAEGATAPPAAPGGPRSTVPSSEAGATLTLGRLYLEQGHLREARRIFGRLVEQDPDNAAARAGLDEIRRAADRRLTAADLLGASPPSDPLRRRVDMLGAYLRRLRRGALRG